VGGGARSGVKKEDRCRGPWDVNWSPLLRGPSAVPKEAKERFP